MKTITIFILLCLIQNISSQVIGEEEPQLVNIFPVGESDSALGFIGDADQGNSGVAGPSAFCFDLNGNLIISDTINDRISWFDQNFQPMKIIALENSFDPIVLEIDDEGNYIGYKGTAYVKKIDPEGSTLFYFLLRGEEIRDNISFDGFYVVDNMVLAYDTWWWNNRI